MSWPLSQPLNGCASCGSSMMGLGAVDLTNVGLQVLAEQIKNLDEKSALEVLTQLPEETVKKICKTGVKDEVSAKVKQYLPWALGAAGVIVLMKVMK